MVAYLIESLNTPLFKNEEKIFKTLSQHSNSLKKFVSKNSRKLREIYEAISYLK